MKLIFDIETNGLLSGKQVMDRIWCISVIDLDTTIQTTYGPANIEDGLKHLSKAETLIGHNIINFDLPALRKTHNWHTTATLLDTLVLARVLWADRRDRDIRWLAANPDSMPRKYLGSHSLASYGYRLGVLKDEYDGDFTEWSEEMREYCIKDVQVTAHLLKEINKKEIDPRWVEIEHEVAKWIRHQHEYGFSFDSDRAADLYQRLCDRRSELAASLGNLFPAWTVREPFTPKVNRPDLGYEKGKPTYKERVVEFNPNSRDHIADRLKDKYQWEPQEFTPEGKPRVDEVVLGKLAYPEAKLLAENFLLTKRIGQLAEGQNAWLKMVQPDGRIHGEVNTNGAVTGRMTHSRPNMAQVPSTRALYGRECRELFVARPGYSLVGVDADALELRCLAHYMAFYDDGEYVKVVLDGKKEDGTDTHSRNAAALGCDRDTAKTWFYAFIYGAGNKKLGSILGGGAKEGRAAKEKFFKALPALGELVSTVQEVAVERGHLKGLDGRPLYIRSQHAALNTLLQAAGAVVMKQALCTFWEISQDLPCAIVANVHDEWQIESKKGNAQDVGERAVSAIVAAGGILGMRCPQDAQFVVGSNWAETH